MMATPLPQQPDATEPVLRSNEIDVDTTLAFIMQLGLALIASGDAVNVISDQLRQVSMAYGMQEARVLVTPTSLWVGLSAGAAVEIDVRPAYRIGLRLDQIDALSRLVRQAERGAIRLPDAQAQLQAILQSRSRFGPIMLIIGQIILAVGLALILQPTPISVACAIVLGLVVGVLKAFSRNAGTFDILLPVFSSFLITVLVFGIIDFTPEAAPLRLLMPPLAIFLPGAALTIATVELAYGEMVSGASRLVAGVLQIALLYFGIAAGAAVMGVPDAQIARNLSLNQLGWWAPPLGVAIFGLGNFIRSTGPRGSFFWLLASLYAAWFGQRVGGLLVGPEMSGFFGGLVMVMVAYVCQGLGGPPMMVSFLPAFWLLVPGAAALISLTQLASADSLATVDNLFSTVISIIAVALGVLVGTAVYRALTTVGGRTMAASQLVFGQYTGAHRPAPPSDVDPPAETPSDKSR